MGWRWRVGWGVGVSITVSCCFICKLSSLSPHKALSLFPSGKFIESVRVTTSNGILTGSFKQTPRTLLPQHVRTIWKLCLAKLLGDIPLAWSSVENSLAFLMQPSQTAAPLRLGIRGETSLTHRPAGVEWTLKHSTHWATATLFSTEYLHHDQLNHVTTDCGPADICPPADTDLCTQLCGRWPSSSQSPCTQPSCFPGGRNLAGSWADRRSPLTPASFHRQGATAVCSSEPWWVDNAPLGQSGRDQRNDLLVCFSLIWTDLKLFPLCLGYFYSSNKNVLKVRFTHPQLHWAKVYQHTFW